MGTKKRSPDEGSKGAPRAPALAAATAGGGTGGGGGGSGGGSGGNGSGGNGMGSGTGAGTDGTTGGFSAVIDKLRGLLTKENLAKLGDVAKRSAVTVTRVGLVPLADTYARPGANEKERLQKTPDTGQETTPPADRLTSSETASLKRAGNKLLLEMGDLLVARYQPAGVTQTELPDRKPDADGFRGEPSLAMAMAAVKGAQTALDARSARNAEATRQAEIKAQAVELQPVSVNLLRVRNRG